MLKRYKRRYGMIAGVLIMVSMLVASKSFVWQITYSGNENTSDMQVEELLKECGFGVGTYIPRVDFYSLCNSFLINTEDFSYISVNMDGTTAVVQLRERKTKDDSESDNIKASNLVAKYSGQIESMTVYSGNSVVGREDVVLEGELLVSGFLEKQYGFEVVRSSGHVYAYVTRDFEVVIPYKEQVKEYTGRENSRSSLSFFGLDIKLLNRRTADFELFDESADRERLVLFDRIRLPLVLTVDSEREYIYTERTLSLEEAREEADRELTLVLQTELAESEILERRVVEYVGEDEYKLTCQVYCITDIAYEKEIITE